MHTHVNKPTYIYIFITHGTVQCDARNEKKNQNQKQTKNKKKTLKEGNRINQRVLRIGGERRQKYVWLIIKQKCRWGKISDTADDDNDENSYKVEAKGDVIIIIIINNWDIYLNIS